MKMIIDAEFRRFDVETRMGRAMDKDGNVIPGKLEPYESKVLRLDVDGEGVIARLWSDTQVDVPATLKRGDMVQVTINGFQSEKEATYLRVLTLIPKVKK